MPGAPEGSAPPWAYLPWLHERIERGDPALPVLGPLSDVQEISGELARRTTISVWNMQRLGPASWLRDLVADTEEIERRGLEARTIYPRDAVRVSPLLPYAVPSMRVGPVTDPFMVIDRSFVVIGDPNAAFIHVSHDDEIVGRGVSWFEQEWDAATPPLGAGALRGVTRRMLRVSVMLVEGATDRQIATALGASERTVSADVAALGKVLGVSGRAQTIARICGL